MDFRVDVFAWIPQPDVPNPLFSVPGGALGPGACGPRFGGDDFVTPPASASAWTGTFRAKQSFAFSASSFGAAPSVTVNTGVIPGTTTVLTNTRAAGGTVCHSMTAMVKKSSASVEWVPGDSWYQVTLVGAAQDPVPAAAASGLLGGLAGSAASAATPNLAWMLALRFQSGHALGIATRALYATISPMNLDVSGRTFPAPASFGSGGNLLHGTAVVTRYPSFVAYVTIGLTTIPVLFADASSRNLAEIVVSQSCLIRQLAF